MLYTENSQEYDKGGNIVKVLGGIVSMEISSVVWPISNYDDILSDRKYLLITV